MTARFLANGGQRDREGQMLALHHAWLEARANNLHTIGLKSCLDSCGWAAALLGFACAPSIRETDLIVRHPKGPDGASWMHVDIINDFGAVGSKGHQWYGFGKMGRWLPQVAG